MLWTSYFGGSYGDHSQAISIAAKAPSGWNGKRYWRQLWPDWEMLKEYKRTGDERLYTRKFAIILEKLDPHVVARELDGRIMLCWEKPGQFCHRHLVANWLRNNSYSVVEI